MNINKSYKFRFYPNKEQQKLIIKTFGCCRFIYNYFLNYKISLYKEKKKNLSKNNIMKLLPIIKCKKEFEWLKEVDSKALQSSLEALDNAYQGFFKLHKGYPKFKSKKDKQFYITKNVNNCIRINSNKILIPKIGWVNFDNHRQVFGNIKRVNISKSKTNKYYISIVCDNIEHSQQSKTGAIIGIDLGIRNFYIDSEGNKVDPPKYYNKAQEKIAKLQKQLSRKPKDSKNREKIRIKLAKVSEHVANQREDFQHKLSRELVNNYDIICCEDLNVKGMIKNHKMAKSVQDVGWSSFINKLNYKMVWEGKQLIKVNRFYPSSKKCNCCGYVNQNLTLNDRFWVCPNCNSELDRDINAAKNILNEGLKY